MYKNLCNGIRAKGFTLLELILVVAMIGLIATFSVTLGSGFLWRSDLSSAQYLSVVALRRAQILAQAQKGDEDWGVHIEENQLTIFKGNDFEDRNVEADEEYDLGSVTTSGEVDVVYHKHSGQPYDSSYEIDLVTQGEIIIITINSEGTISY